jgi:hypothetical protein
MNRPKTRVGRVEKLGLTRPEARAGLRGSEAPYPSGRAWGGPVLMKSGVDEPERSHEFWCATFPNDMTAFVPFQMRADKKIE